MNYLGIDHGSKRIGLALASGGVAVARPLVTLANDDAFWPELAKIIQTEAVGLIVCGRPRGLDGQTTSQTQTTEQFAAAVRTRTGLPVELADEAATSALAAEHKAPDIDAAAAALILQDYLDEHQK